MEMVEPKMETDNKRRSTINPHLHCTCGRLQTGHKAYDTSGNNTNHKFHARQQHTWPPHNTPFSHTDGIRDNRDSPWSILQTPTAFHSNLSLQYIWHEVEQHRQTFRVRWHNSYRHWDCRWHWFHHTLDSHGGTPLDGVHRTCMTSYQPRLSYFDSIHPRHKIQEPSCHPDVNQNSEVNSWR